MNIWIFGTFKWQGNPKALFVYMTKYMSESHECWWVSDSRQDAEEIKKFGFRNVIYGDSEQAKKVYSKTDVYVCESFRITYPDELPPSAIIFNTWHGVGLKHIELGIDPNSRIANQIIEKNIRNFTLYRNRTFFLVTSPAMKKHFIADTLVPERHMVEGGYPRNLVYADPSIRTSDTAHYIRNTTKNYSRVGLFAPTWRSTRTNGLFSYLLPNLTDLENTLAELNDLLIIKVHPMMQSDQSYRDAKEIFKKSHHLLFWDDKYDIYEAFPDITFAIIDYSSIFYDLLASGVTRFIRYVPDYQEYTRDAELIADYFEFTGGVVAETFFELLSTIKLQISPINNKEYLINYFFEYSDIKTIRDLVREVDSLEPSNESHPELHSFDIFDTLIRRKTIEPQSIFLRVQSLARDSGLDFPLHLLENWPKMRNRVERDVRHLKRQNSPEHDSHLIEITYDAIYERLADNVVLNPFQIEFLKNAEIQAELEHVEPISERIALIFHQLDRGNDVILVSDMYLPETVIRNMLEKADIRLLHIPLYLSSSVGYQKSTGTLFKHIFFKSKYKYHRWVHYGDNHHADGRMPRKLGIETFVHQMDAFIPYEKFLIDHTPAVWKYDAYRLASRMQRYRKQLHNAESSQVFEKKYYSYAYAGMALVPYVHWTILDAVRRGYETLYFISRDGHFLKQIADRIIDLKGYNICTKFIYGSRHLWRVPSFVHGVDPETFGPFGNFAGIGSFQELVQASLIPEPELLSLFPQFESYRNAGSLEGETVKSIRKTLSESEPYKQILLQIATEKRGTVIDYLKQNIDFSERFAFVEFWGRGYTQNTFGRLLNVAAGQSILNAFYYVRSFSANWETTVRHNFILSDQNFSFLEPILAATPYQSVKEYKRDPCGLVHPVIIEQPSDIADILSEGLRNFVDEYILVADENEGFIRCAAECAYEYQINTTSDQFLCNVYADLKDNICSYGQPRPVAPALTLRDLEMAGDKRDLARLTTNASMSLARSAQEVRDYYRTNAKQRGWPNALPRAVNNVYAAWDLANYVRSEELPFKVVCTTRNSTYFDISFGQTSRNRRRWFNQYDIVDIIAIDWLNCGVPRLLTPFGYITANMKSVQRITEGQGKDQLVDLRALIRNAPSRASSHGKRKYREQSGMIGLIAKMCGFNKSDEMHRRKWRKFICNPYHFCKDARNPVTRRLLFLFDHRHFLGRMSTRCVRSFFGCVAKCEWLGNSLK